jgi:uncharacterized membrane protein YfcA
VVLPLVEVAPALTLAAMVVVGFTLGVFGGGGSILAVPVLVYIARVTPAAAVGMSLAIVGATSLTAAYAHRRHGHVHPRVALAFGGAGAATAFLGARLTHLVSDRALMLAFAALMVAVGAWMLVGRARRPADSAGGPQRPRLLPGLIAGATVGAVTGFLGVGGGFLVVPALMAFGGLGMRAAIGTSLLVIAINSGAGFVGHLGGDGLDFGLIASLSVVAVVAALVGERSARRLPVEKLRGAFALFVIVVGVMVAATGGLPASTAR